MFPRRAYDAKQWPLWQISLPTHHTYERYLYSHEKKKKIYITKILPLSAAFTCAWNAFFSEFSILLYCYKNLYRYCKKTPLKSLLQVYQNFLTWPESWLSSVIRLSGSFWLTFWIGMKWSPWNCCQKISTTCGVSKIGIGTTCGVCKMAFAEYHE